jgi:hypothetical protein
MANAATSVHTRTVRPPGADRPSQHKEYFAPTIGRGPSDPRTRTVRVAAESTAADTPRSDAPRSAPTPSI